jgi:hypothetical protein
MLTLLRLPCSPVSGLANGLRCAAAHTLLFHYLVSKGLRPSRSQGIPTCPAASPRIPVTHSAKLVQDCETTSSE